MRTASSNHGRAAGYAASSARHLAPGAISRRPTPLIWTACGTTGLAQHYRDRTDARRGVGGRTWTSMRTRREARCAVCSRRTLPTPPDSALTTRRPSMPRLERSYFQEMAAFLRGEVGVRQPILGSSDHNHGWHGALHVQNNADPRPHRRALLLAASALRQPRLFTRGVDHHQYADGRCTGPFGAVPALAQPRVGQALYRVGGQPALSQRLSPASISRFWPHTRSCRIGTASSSTASAQECGATGRRRLFRPSSRCTTIRSRCRSWPPGRCCSCAAMCRRQNGGTAAS